MNYKAQLAALSQLPTSKNERLTEQQKTVEAQSMMSPESDIEGEVPESCIDWLAVEEGLKSQV